MLLEESRHGLCVAAVLADAQGQGLQPLDEQEGVERTEGVAEVALQRHPRLQDVGDRAERLHRFRPHGAVVARVGLIEHGEARGMLLPVELAAVDDQAADRVAMPARSEEHTSELPSLMRISYAV